MAEPRGPLTGPELDKEIDELALQYPEYGPDEFVPWGDRLSSADGRRAAELQSAQRQIEVDNLAAELWPADDRRPPEPVWEPDVNAEWHAGGGVYVRQPQAQLEAG